jgi:hypothetical protein
MRDKISAQPGFLACQKRPEDLSEKSYTVMREQIFILRCPH